MGRARLVGQGLCRGLPQRGRRGTPAPSGILAPSFQYSQLSLHDGHQKQTPQNKHTAPELMMSTQK